MRLIRWGQSAIDYKLDRIARTVQWLIVLGFGLALLPGPHFKDIRIIAGIIVVAFLAWPNFAYGLTELFKRPTEGQKGY